MKQQLWRHRWLSIWSVAVAALVLGLIVQTTARSSQQQVEAHGHGLQFTWEFYPKSFREARDKATLIVLEGVWKGGKLMAETLIVARGGASCHASRTRAT